MKISFLRCKVHNRPASFLSSAFVCSLYSVFSSDAAKYNDNVHETTSSFYKLQKHWLTLCTSLNYWNLSGNATRYRDIWKP